MCIELIVLFCSFTHFVHVELKRNNKIEVEYQHHGRAISMKKTLTFFFSRNSHGVDWIDQIQIQHKDNLRVKLQGYE